MLVDVVQETAVGHELGDQLDGGAQAHTEEAHQVGVLHTGHDQCLLGERGGEDTESGLSGQQWTLYALQHGLHWTKYNWVKMEST